jgi:hypothetical protein
MNHVIGLGISNGRLIVEVLDGAFNLEALAQLDPRDSAAAVFGAEFLDDRTADLL